MKNNDFDIDFDIPEDILKEKKFSFNDLDLGVDFDLSFLDDIDESVLDDEPKIEVIDQPAPAKKPASEAPVKKPAARKTAARKDIEIIIQSPMGGEISGAEILERVGKVDKVYVRVDANKAYWVRGEESGSVDLW